MTHEPVQLAPFADADHVLAGVIVCGRWPRDVDEWGEALALVTRLSVVPGLVRGATVFHSSEERPNAGAQIEHPVGVVLADGPVMGEDAPAPGSLGQPQPAATMIVHPPGEMSEHASGCVFLPGLPHLGLPHRAAWVQAGTDGGVQQVLRSEDVDPAAHPDTAVLAMLVAA